MSTPRRSRVTAVIFLSALSSILTAPPVAAHQAWFVNDADAYPLDPAALLSPKILVAGVAVSIIAVAWRAVAARLPAPEFARIIPTRSLAALVPWVPRVVAAHLGISLLFLAFNWAVLDPGIQAPGGVSGFFLLTSQAVVGVLLIAGILVRVAAVVIMLAGPVLVALQGPDALLTSAVLFGLAVFLFFLPPTLKNGGRRELDSLALRRASLALKLGAGTTLISLAIFEKLANPAMAKAMLNQVPALNILAPLGIDADGFVVFAGSMELLLGLLVLSGALPQVVALVAAVPFTATLALFGTTELLGHLPVYGVLLTFLILGSKKETSLTLSGLFRLTAHVNDTNSAPGNFAQSGESDT